MFCPRKQSRTAPSITAPKSCPFSFSALNFRFAHESRRVENRPALGRLHKLR